MEIRVNPILQNTGIVQVFRYDDNVEDRQEYAMIGFRSFDDAKRFADKIGGTVVELCGHRDTSHEEFSFYRERKANRDFDMLKVLRNGYSMSHEFPCYFTKDDALNEQSFRRRITLRALRENECYGIDEQPILEICEFLYRKYLRLEDDEILAITEYLFRDIEECMSHCSSLFRVFKKHMMAYSESDFSDRAYIIGVMP